MSHSRMGFPRERAPLGARLVTDVSPARWLEDQLYSWDGPPEQGVRLGSFLPRGFASYARLLHPGHVTGTDVPISWSDLAARTGKTVHPLMQFGRLLSSDDLHGEVSSVLAPQHGHLPLREGRILAETMVGFTSTPGGCYFCVWEGNGFLDPDLYVGVPRVELPGRRHLLFASSVQGVLAFLDETNLWPSPALWWPADRSWCVSTEIDLFDTYVAGSPACVEGILADPRLEAFQVSIDDRIDFWADTVNV